MHSSRQSSRLPRLNTSLNWIEHFGGVFSNSPLFGLNSDMEDRSAKIAPLPNLGGVLTRPNKPTAPTLILTKSYPVFMLHAMLGLLRSHAESDEVPLRRFVDNNLHHNYLTKLAAMVSGQQSGKSASVANKSTNWFLKGELSYSLDVLAVLVKDGRNPHLGINKGPSVPIHHEGDDAEMETEDEQLTSCETTQTTNGRLLLPVAFKVLLHLSEEFYPAIVRLLDEIVFVRDFYPSQLESLGNGTVTAEELQRWKFNYKVKLKSLVKREENSSDRRHNNYTVAEWRDPLLAPTWPYSLLYLLLEKTEQGSAKLQHYSEEQIIRTTLQFSELLEQNSILLASVTHRLMYLMTAFLGPDAKFLDGDISALITRRIDDLRTEMLRRGERFDFDVRLEERKSFHGLYQLVLDIFQSSSYGHAPFSALVMAPLAQCYDIQWRNLVWSEHVAVLRFITCSEQQLFGTIDDYLQPVETDVTLLKFYSQALNSNLLRPGSIPARIAAHHLNEYRAKANERKVSNNDIDK